MRAHNAERGGGKRWRRVENSGRDAPNNEGAAAAGVVAAAEPKAPKAGAAGVAAAAVEPNAPKAGAAGVAAAAAEPNAPKAGAAGVAAAAVEPNAPKAGAGVAAAAPNAAAVAGAAAGAEEKLNMPRAGCSDWRPCEKPPRAASKAERGGGRLRGLTPLALALPAHPPSPPPGC